MKEIKLRQKVPLCSSKFDILFTRFCVEQFFNENVFSTLAQEIHSVLRRDFLLQILFTFGLNYKFLSIVESQFAALKFAFVYVMIYNRDLCQFFTSTKFEPMEKLGKKLLRNFATTRPNTLHTNNPISKKLIREEVNLKQ